MGYALAETLLAHGETVVVIARQVDSVAALLKQYPASAFGHQLDVTQAGRIAEVSVTTAGTNYLVAFSCKGRSVLYGALLQPTSGGDVRAAGELCWASGQCGGTVERLCQERGDPHLVLRFAGDHDRQMRAVAQIRADMGWV